MFACIVIIKSTSYLLRHVRDPKKNKLFSTGATEAALGEIPKLGTEIFFSPHLSNSLYYVNQQGAKVNHSKSHKALKDKSPKLYLLILLFMPLIQVKLDIQKASACIHLSIHGECIRAPIFTQECSL